MKFLTFLNRKRIILTLLTIVGFDPSVFCININHRKWKR